MALAALSVCFVAPIVSKYPAVSWLKFDLLLLVYCLLLCCLQHDNLVPTMTAYEAVSFYASIILPHGTPKAARRARIARVLRMMGLTEQQHTLVSSNGAASA